LPFVWTHFRSLHESTVDIEKILPNCDMREFELLMHQGQDYFSHYSKGYRTHMFHGLHPRHWGPGHMFAGHAPDEDNVAWEKADQWTRSMLARWEAQCTCLAWERIDSLRDKLAAEVAYILRPIVAKPDALQAAMLYISTGNTWKLAFEQTCEQNIGFLPLFGVDCFLWHYHPVFMLARWMPWGWIKYTPLGLTCKGVYKLGQGLNRVGEIAYQEAGYFYSDLKEFKCRYMDDFCAWSEPPPC
jgi:hypothetical protein